MKALHRAAWADVFTPARHPSTIYRLPLPLVRAASTSSEQHPTSPPHPLVSWVTAGGGTVNGVAVRQWNGADGGSGYGLQASQACPAGTPLIILPPSLHLTYDNAITDPRLLALIAQVPTELWGAKLALQLLAHRLQGDASPFEPYIANLPQGFPGLPMFFPPDAVQALSYPPVTEQVKRRCRWLLNFSKDVLAPLPGTQADPFEGVAIDANALGWALGAVTSRAFRTRGPDQPAALLPLIDMANHSFEPNAKIAAVPKSKGTLAMVAVRDLEPDEPILISYGGLPNDFLLLDYGFICADNPHDTVQLRFDRNLIEAAKAWAGVGSAGSDSLDAPDAPLPQLPTWQAAALATLGLQGPNANLEVNILQAAPSNGSTCPVDPRLLAGTRVLCAANASELNGASGLEALGRWDAPLSVRNEAATLRTLSGVCLLALAQLPGSEEDDVALLQKGIGGAPISSDVQLAIRFRLEKKRLLTCAARALAARLQEVQSGTGFSVEGARKGEKRVKEAKPAGKGFGR